MRLASLAALLATSVLVTFPAASEPSADPAAHAFDPQLGSWRTHVRRLRKPLSGSADWVEYDGTTVVRPILGGRANIAELEIAGPAGGIEGAALRLHQPATRRWTIHYFSAAQGELTAPLSGTFRDGRGLFEGDDTLGDRPIRVRFVIIPEGPGRFRFEQSFSGDGGRTWELNWVATDTRTPGR